MQVHLPASNSFFISSPSGFLTSNRENYGVNFASGSVTLIYVAV